MHSFNGVRFTLTSTVGHVPKFYRSTLDWLHGHDENLTTFVDPNNPLPAGLITPDENSPICQKCQLYNKSISGCKHPFIPYSGSEDPLVTVIYENVSAKEDEMGQLARDGVAGFIHKIICELAPDIDFDVNRLRWVPLTRCAVRTGKLPNYATKGRLCRHYAIQDLQLHPPKVIMPVGSTALGLLS